MFRCIACGQLESYNGTGKLATKIFKSIRGLENLSYRERLIKLGLTTLLERRARGDLIIIFKIESGFVAYGQHMFRKGSTGRQFLLTPASSSQSYQDQFKCRSIMYWNGLPLAARTASSVSDFKKMLYEHKKISAETGILNGFWELSEEVYINEYEFSKL